MLLGPSTGSGLTLKPAQLCRDAELVLLVHPLLVAQSFAVTKSEIWPKTLQGRLLDVAKARHLMGLQQHLKVAWSHEAHKEQWRCDTVLVLRSRYTFSSRYGNVYLLSVGSAARSTSGTMYGRIDSKVKTWTSGRELKETR